MLNNLRRIALLLVVLLLIAVPCAAGIAPKNIILFIGDGMGFGQVTATGYECAARNRELALTNPANNLVTDSAAGATALATGVKTTNGTIALDPEGKRLRTILEAAREMGKSTGVVTTDNITGATPAAFYAHVRTRGQQEDIAAQLISARVNVALGSGKSRFVPKTTEEPGREDGRDILADAKKRGYDVVFTGESLKSSGSDRIIGLFSDETFPTLAEMTSTAISVLSRNRKGFFLMSESSRIDGGGHGNDQKRVVQGVLDLDEALSAALKFAKAEGGTLIIVTADHETGGMAVQNPDAGNSAFTSQWTGKGHTANMVPIYAYGPGSEEFSGTRDNTEIAKICAGLWRLKLN